MAVSVGTLLGPYETLAQIGKGGMGEVWKARDTRLGRIVAVKVSQENFPERFELEARAIAALNHPNICTLHDVGPNYLVMEYIEGTPLKGPLPLDQALRYAAQICNALEAAHKKGIIHRDLKPANILLTKSGVKLLDFGLAKLRSRGAVTVDNKTVTMSLTGKGIILGTLHYMAPEQLEGKDTDERSDIFAVGCVLYELITGKRPFEGTSAASLIAAILEKKPEPLKPDGLNRVIEICLAKDPDERWQNAKDVQRALELNPARAVTRPSSRWGSPVTWSAAALMGLIAAVFAWFWLFRPAPVSVPVRFAVEAPPGVIFNYMITATAVSPDGRFLVFRAGGGTNVPALWLRPLDSLEAHVLSGTEGADFPFWSPDSKSIGFFAQDKLKRIDITGDAPLVLCDVVFGAAAAGGAWNRNGVIVFGDKRGLFRIPDSGGTPASLFTADDHREGGFGFPQFLPDGRHLLFYVAGRPEMEGVYASSLDRPQTRALVLKTSSKAIYAPAVLDQPSQIVYVRDRNLLAQRFNSAKLRAEGDPVLLAKDVAELPSLRGAAFWLSDTGLLVYRSGLAFERAKLIWRHRDGRRLGEAAPESSYTALRLAPDAKRVAIGRRDTAGPGLIWIVDFSRGVTTRLTSHAQVEARPTWSPDGRYVGFSSSRSGVYQIFRIEPNGLRAEEQLTDGPLDKYLCDWSRDGKYLLYSQGSPGAFDIWVKPNAAANAGGPDLPILQTPFDEGDAQFSPDGKWIAYSSNASGRYEIYVIGFSPNVESQGRWQISNGGGRAPRWRGDGQELYYLTTDDNKLMAVRLRTAERVVQAETPHELLTASALGDSGDNPFPYDVTPDGQQFLMEETAGAQASIPLTVVMNWQVGLKK